VCVCVCVVCRVSCVLCYVELMSYLGARELLAPWCFLLASGVWCRAETSESGTWVFASRAREPYVSGLHYINSMSTRADDLLRGLAPVTGLICGS
jgi:hypothetical protein